MEKKKVSETKALREAAGMTQEKFAEALGVSVWAVRDWENGRRSPDRRSRQALIKFRLEDRS